MSAETPRDERVRAAEVIGALCLATDLGMGFPFEHGLRSTLVAARLAESLGAEPETASQTYYACLLFHSGCTTDAYVTAEIFGGSLTTHLNPVVYGSRRQVLTGIVRALPEPEVAAPVRAIQIARRLPKAAREQRPHLTAMCEVAQMLADGVGLPPSVQVSSPTSPSVGTARARSAGRRARRSPCRCGSSMSLWTPHSSAF